MKKLYSALMLFAMMMVVAVGFIACGSDEEDSGSTQTLVGTWDILSVAYYDANGTYDETEDGDGAYYVFLSNNKVTFHGDGDLLDGETINYSFDGKTLTFAGFYSCTVIECTATKMVLKQPIFEGYCITTLKKR